MSSPDTPTTDAARDAVRQQIREALGIEWAEFESRHPALAAALDKQMMIELALTRLADDPAYQKAIADAEASSLTISTIEALLQGKVRSVLEKLVT